jgi:hypothetical protein
VQELRGAQDRVTWPELGTIVAISTVSGSVVATPFYIATELRGLSRLDALALAPVIGFWVVVSCFFFAAVGSVIAAIPVLMLRRSQLAKDLFAWMTTGVLLGCVIGALHPFVLLSAIVEQATGDGPSGTLRLAALTAVGGGLSGMGVGWWFAPRHRRGVVLAHYDGPGKSSSTGNEESCSLE